MPVAFLLLVQTLGSSGVAPPNQGMANVVTLFSVDDYPPEAVRKGWQGTVIVDLLVSPEGRVSACRVVQSSGHAVLDQQTCKIMQTRARFVPAKDKDGNAVEDVVRSPPIMWRLSR